MEMTDGELSSHGDYTYAFTILPRSPLCYRLTNSGLLASLPATMAA